MPLSIDNTTYRSKNYDERPGEIAPSAIVIHSTEGVWPSDAQWLCNPKSGVSAHYVIAPNGQIYCLVDDRHRAWHAGVSALGGVPDVNDFSIGVELSYKKGSPAYPEIQHAALTWLCQSLIAAYHIALDRVVSHRATALKPNGQTGRKQDPTDWSEPAFRLWVASLAPLQPSAYSPASPLIGSPLASALRWSGAKSAYDLVATRIITNAYWTQATRVGLDPILAFAQCLHETGNLTSWWCQRPRRNPAGIGVTGQTSVTPRSPDWAYNPKDALWHAGLSFASWADDAIPAHLGRLLGYAIHPTQMTTAQKALFVQATALRPLPNRVLGCAPTRQGLEGTWAVPGDQYADAIARIANRLREAR